MAEPHLFVFKWIEPPLFEMKEPPVNDQTMTETYAEAVRENWARDLVAANGKPWTTHMAKFSGAVVPR